MLTFAQLQEYYKDFPTAQIRKNILVEYLQYELLQSIFKQKGSENLSFMAGTAIRICLDGKRFSEDLYFDNFGLSFKEFKNLLEFVIKDMQLKGFLMEIRFVEKGAFHCYIKFPKILYENNLSNQTKEKILVRIDSVQRKKNFTSKPYIVNKFDIYGSILFNPPEIILAQKLLTVFERKREKGRDFYDVSFLYGKYKADFNYIENFLQMKKSDFISKFLKKCQNFNYRLLAKELQPFLINPQEINRVTGFYEFAKQKMATD